MNDLIQIILAPIAIVAGCTWILKALFNQLLSRDIENYKSRLSSELEMAKVHLDNELQLRYFEFQTRFSLLHQKQAEVIGDLYGMLAEAYEIISHIASPISTHDAVTEAQLIQEASEKYNLLAKYFVTHKIYFDEEVSCEIDRLLRLLKKTVRGVSIGKSRPGASTQEWMNVWPIISEEVPVVLKQLEAQFRQHLSATKSNNSATGDQCPKKSSLP